VSLTIVLLDVEFLLLLQCWGNLASVPGKVKVGSYEYVVFRDKKLVREQDMDKHKKSSAHPWNKRKTSSTQKLPLMSIRTQSA
jgi:hypothetical protein